MTLLDLLQKLSPDTLIGIWNIDDKRAKCPTPQTYQKAGNIQWNKIRNIIGYEVMAICVNEKNGGLFVRVYNKARLDTRGNGYGFAALRHAIGAVRIPRLERFFAQFAARPFL